MPYDFSIDVWSAACTLYELYTGRILFPGRNNNDMLRLFMELKGRFNNKMLKRGEFTSQHFDEDNNFLRQDVDKLAADQVSIKVVSITKPLKDMRARLLKNTNELREGDKEMLLQFVDFLDRCLALSPDKRLTPKEALQHPFLKHSNAHFDKLNQ
jgi:serine/threonine-protein kinase PRP4